MIFTCRLSTIAEQHGSHEEALQILNQGLQYAPFHVNLWQALAKNLAHVGQLDKAITATRKLVELEPMQYRYHFLLSSELANAGQFEEGLDACQQALALAPNSANIYLQLGHLLKTLGQRTQCEQAYKQSISLEKINGTAYWALADLKSYQFDDTEKKAMYNLVSNSQTPPAQAAQACFALAKSHEDNHDYNLAFEHYLKANNLRPDVNFEPKNYQAKCELVRHGFSKQVLKLQAKFTEQQPTPIFIVGLTRSGSTLLEQILSSHSDVEGTMELYSLPRVVRRLEKISNRKGITYPELMAQLSPQDLSALGQGYLKDTEIYRNGKPYFIDKMPPNFHNVGLIHMILPNAIIIDARRHPLSTGFSNFKQHFAKGYDFSYDLANIGHYYNSYLALMDHWDEVMPEEVLCIQYENLIQDTENQIRQLLHHCGLPFQASCLNFHANKRAVRTASSEQVRQPINTKGMEQWRHFDAFLTPLKEALGEQTLKRFAQWA